MPLHVVDASLVRALASGDAKARVRFAERMQCVPRFLETHARRATVPLAQARIRELSEEALARFLARLPTYRAEVTLEGAAGMVVAEVLSERCGLRGSESGLAITQALGRIAPGEARILRARHYEAIPAEGLALRLGISQELASCAYVSGLARLRTELAHNAPVAGGRIALTDAQHEELDRWTTGAATPDPGLLARSPELASALSELRQLQAALEAAGTEERNWFQVAGRDPLGPQAVPWVGEVVERAFSGSGRRAARRGAMLLKIGILLGIAAIVVLTLCRGS